MLSVRRATVNYLIAGFDYWLFLSTPSVRRATLHLWPVLRSIRHFYPRPPRGGRLLIITPQGCKGRISIHALREEGDCSRRGAGRGAVAISIHALREEGDNGPLRVMHPSRAFLSTPSARRATRCSKVPTSSQTISIHALREEGDNTKNALDDLKTISIHALREEGDRPVPGSGRP